jgi:hypothetical protein
MFITRIWIHISSWPQYLNCYKQFSFSSSEIVILKGSSLNNRNNPLITARGQLYQLAVFRERMRDRQLTALLDATLLVPLYGCCNKASDLIRLSWRPFRMDVYESAELHWTFLDFVTAEGSVPGECSDHNLMKLLITKFIAAFSFISDEVVIAVVVL